MPVNKLYTKAIAVRGVPPLVWRSLKAAAVKRGVTVGTLLTSAINDFLGSQK